MAFPKTLYVRTASDDESLVEAFQTFHEAVEDDGPTEVGVYELVDTKTFEKTTQEIDKK